MVKNYTNFLQGILLVVFLFFLPNTFYAQCAGNDAILPPICDYANPANASIDLFSLLGPATPGGKWSDVDKSGGLDPVTGFLNVHVITSSGFYHYTYTVAGVAGCADNSSTVFVTIGGYTGKPSQTIICSALGSYNLFQAFDGRYLSPLLDGTWHNDADNSIVPGSSIDVTKLNGLYSFTYTMDAVGTCVAPPPANISVKVVKAPEPGDPKPPLKVCSDAVASYTNYDLFNMLTNNPDPEARGQILLYDQPKN
ncbi:hypothetical protein [Flavobacterium sp. N1736]|uniref:hypothetical protein n=1 Tax=Flavobacterium sp. N1736 TaxID=2986823 RepID=UPI0022241F4A|nr:hypothetical protein [Flavobacterium sp. N1736]